MSERTFKSVTCLFAMLALIGAVLVWPSPVVAEGEPILVGCSVPRASAYGQNGERGLILAGDAFCHPHLRRLLR